MATRDFDEEAVFHVAREITNPDIRAKHLNQICAGDWALRDRVAAMLEADWSQAYLKRLDDDPTWPAWIETE